MNDASRCCSRKPEEVVLCALAIPHLFQSLALKLAFGVETVGKTSRPHNDRTMARTGMHQQAFCPTETFV
jgi:hypothetical protein